MDKNIQQTMLPGSVAWFIQKKPVRILNILAIIMSVIFVAFILVMLIDESVFDDFTGIHVLFFFMFLFAWAAVAIIASIRVSHDKTVYIKENGYMFKVVPAISGPGTMYGGIAGGLIGAAIGSAIDAASDNGAAVGSGVLGMVHTNIGIVHQLIGISLIEEKDSEFIVTAATIQYLKSGRMTKPRKQKLRIGKTFLAVDSLMAELNFIKLQQNL